MKTKSGIFLLMVLPAFILSCRDKIEDIYTVNEPVYMSYDDLRNAVKSTDDQEIVQPGKIYYRDHYIFINEYQKGIHIIDNSDPHSPELKKFIEIPGNVDMAIYNDILYADSYVDLVAIDISNMEDIREVKRIKDAFPYLIPFCEAGVTDVVDPAKGVVTAWRTTQRKVNIDRLNNSYDIYPQYRGEIFFMDGVNAVTSGTGAGTGGSMARFTIAENYLYTVDTYMLRLFDISNAADPVPGGELYVGWNIETLFPYAGKLFMGSTTGMYIYSIENPADPEFLSVFSHVSSCDPVVVDGNLAYVTLRAGNLCGDDTSQLDVIDISNVSKPKLLKWYPMEEPYGLGTDNKLLFVCDGEAGLKVYDATDPLAIDKNMIASYENINAWDVIPVDGILIMTGTDGLVQYDYSDPEHIRQVSVIPIENIREQ